MRHRPGSSVLMFTLGLLAAVAQFEVRAQQLPQLAPTYRFDAARLDALHDAKVRGLNYIPGEVAVRFKPGMGPARQQRALDVVRSRPRVSDLEWFGETAVLRDLTQPNSLFMAQQLASQPEVEYAEPHYIRRLPVRPRSQAILDVGDPSIQRTPNDPHFGLLQWNFTLIGMPQAWDINPGATQDVIIGVVDTGITTVNQSFTFPLYTGSLIQTVSLPFAVSPDLPVSRMVSQRDFVFFNSGTPVLDMEGHGTHVASTIAEETNNNFRAAGIAYNARIMPIKACVGYWELMIAEATAGRPGFNVDVEDGFCSSVAMAAGIRYAANNGAKVINVSIGGPGQVNDERAAITEAVSRGAFVSISAGNDFEDGNPTIYPAQFAASINGAMSVAAIGKSQRRAYYSSTGSWVEIAAPGGDFTDGGGQDAGLIWQTTLLPSDQDPLRFIPRFDNYATVPNQGTSMAAPHVAGLAALLVSQGVTRPEAIEALIRATAKDLGTAGKDNDFGYGLIQPRAALRGLGIRK
jgi:serine protease